MTFSDVSHTCICLPDWW